jgi:alcohol-forming fatty acyl-CoA reductase
MSSETLKDFYHGKSIFLTGGTGFLGRLILAKLMRIGNVKEVVLLSRPKKGKSNEERLDSILEGFLFQEMEKFDSKFRSKVKLVNGDMEIHNLGISDDDREYIKKNTQIVIHGAATVRFDEDLKKAIAINVQGTKSILDIATECSKLQSFVHISTAYSNCPRMEIEEKFYPPPVDYRECIKLAENCDNHVLNVTTEKLIHPWPNTYTFTKAIAEDLVRQYLDRLPVGIIRPSIGKSKKPDLRQKFNKLQFVVQSTLEDPVAGFVDKLIGPVGLGVGIMAGLIRIVKTSTKVFTDIVPADIVVNSTLAIAQYTFKVKSGQHGQAPIFNTSVNKVRKLTICKYTSSMRKPF